MQFPKTLTEFFEHTINVIFAVVIGLSFQVSSQIIIPVDQIANHPVNTGILILGYIIVIGGWIGYFLSVKEHPHKGKKGVVRFFLDVLTLYLFFYIINLAKIENGQYQKDVFLYLLPITFGVYLCWDIVKYFEYKKRNQTNEEKTDRIHRIRITIDYLFWFVVLAIVYHALPSFNEDMEYKYIIFLIISIILTIMYRYAKYTDSVRVKAKKRIARKSKGN